MPTILGELAGVESKSFWYMNLHVISKFSLPFSISVAILFVKDPLSALSIVLIAAASCFAAGISLSTLNRYIAVIVSMSAFIVLTFSLFTYIPGRPLYEAVLWSVHAEKGVFEWKIRITDSGLMYATVFVLRIFAMVLSATLLLATLTDRDLVWGLRSLKLPLGACVAASLFFRGIQMFVSDFYTVREAMMARGIEFAKTPLAKRFLLYVNALIPLLSLMITRSFEVSLALESRGIAPSSRASSTYHEYFLKHKDYLVIVVSVLLSIVYAVWWWVA
ncbi:MAG: energy-coupling factor transporter transmembrane component T [Thermofilaceae archaeon]